jgi:hypothetical protein
MCCTRTNTHLTLQLYIIQLYCNGIGNYIAGSLKYDIDLLDMLLQLITSTINVLPVYKSQSSL